MDKVILHCDLNNFYASVATLLDDSLRGKPVAVCGDPKKRHGIVLAKSMEAKKCGVTTGEAIWEARQKCPDLILVAPEFEKYVYYSNQVRAIYARYTDKIESFGIDECWLDVTGSTKLFGSGEKIADDIRETVKRETGLTISVGVSFSKVFAKLGSDLKKPDAVTVINRDNYKRVVWPLAVDEMLMIGHRTAKKLTTFNIKTIGELANCPPEVLRPHFGIIADRMIADANGGGDDEVSLNSDKRVPKSVGHGTTTSKDICTLADAKIVIYALSEMVATRLRRYNLIAGGVALSVRDTNLESFSRQCQLDYPTANANDIAEKAIKLLKDNYNFKTPARTLSVYVFKLTENDAPVQISMFEDDGKESKLEKSVDKIRQKYGYHSVKRAILLENDLLNGELHDDDDFLPFKRD